MSRNRQDVVAAWLLTIAAALGHQALAQEVVGHDSGMSRPPAALPNPENDGMAGLVEKPRFDRLLHEAELAYRAQDNARALAAFSKLVELDRLSVRAWLRLGNLHQQAGRTDEAVTAYRQATLGVPLSRIDEEARSKAFANLALLGMEQARDAIDALEKGGSTRVRGARRQVADQLQSERKRFERVEPRSRDAARSRSRGRGRPTGSAPGAQGTVPAAGPGAGMTEPLVTPVHPGSVTVRNRADPAFEPYTVDRWIATPRRQNTATARSALIEPLVEDPLPRQPVVEYIGASGSAPGRAAGNAAKDRP